MFLNFPKDEYYQWDTGQVVQLTADATDVTEVHMHNNRIGGPALVLAVKTDEAGARYVEIPDLLFQKSGRIRFWAAISDSERAYTIEEYDGINVLARAKPTDYAYSEPEVLYYKELLEQIDEMSQDWDKLMSEEVPKVEQAVADANAAITDATNAADAANDATDKALNAAGAAQAAASNANNAAERANTAADEFSQSCALATVNAAKIETLEANVADLMYEPIAIRSLQNAAGTVELGATVNSIIFTWALNKDPVSQTLEGVAISPSQRQHEFGGISLKSTKSYTLTATDERGAIASQSTTVYFYNGVYYGKLDADAALDSAAILSLTRKLQSGKSTTFTVNAGDAQKIAYALPTRYGTPAFNVGGFDGGFTKAATVNFTNSSGYTESYDIWLSDNVGLGNTTVKVS